MPNTIGEVVAALRQQKLKVSHDQQDWGDWINLEGCETVISIESVRGLTTTATIELSENDSSSLQQKIEKAFASLDWQGIDDEGVFQLG